MNQIFRDFVHDTKNFDEKETTSFHLVSSSNSDSSNKQVMTDHEAVTTSKKSFLHTGVSDIENNESSI